MSKDDPSMFDEGHGPLSSRDEAVGAVIGVAGAAAGWAVSGGNPWAAAAGGAVGYLFGEEAAD